MKPLTLAITTTNRRRLYGKEEKVRCANCWETIVRQPATEIRYGPYFFCTNVCREEFLKQSEREEDYDEDENIM